MFNSKHFYQLTVYTLVFLSTLISLDTFLYGQTVHAIRKHWNFSGEGYSPLTNIDPCLYYGGYESARLYLEGSYTKLNTDIYPDADGYEHWYIKGVFTRHYGLIDPCAQLSQSVSDSIGIHYGGDSPSWDAVRMRRVVSGYSNNPTPIISESVSPFTWPFQDIIFGTYHSYWPYPENYNLGTTTSLADGDSYDIWGIGNTSEDSLILDIIEPLEDSIWVAGTKDTIKWISKNVNPDIYLITNWDLPIADTILILSNVSPPFNADGEYEVVWDIPETIFSYKSKILLCKKNHHFFSPYSDLLIKAESKPFSIKPYWLTRLIEDNKIYDKFIPNKHGWSIPHTEEQWWPLSVYPLYTSEIDPYTNKLYPVGFPNTGNNAWPEDFPSWPTYVDAFGKINCYIKMTINGVDEYWYSNYHLKMWSNITGILSPPYEWYKYRGWGGSCFGISTTAGMAFSNYFTDLFNLSMDPAGNVRDKVNMIFTRQFGEPTVFWRMNHCYNSLTTTVSLLKNYLLLSNPDRYLLFIRKMTGEGHSVLPYKLKQNPDFSDLWYLYVFDPNYPGIECKFTINLPNTWIYDTDPDYNSLAYGRMFLDTQVNQLYSEPLIWSLASHKMAYIGATGKVNIRDDLGQTLLFQDSTVTGDLTSVMPIYPESQESVRPLGYACTGNNFYAEVESFFDSLFYFDVFIDSSLYSIIRFDSKQIQFSRLLFEHLWKIF